MKFHLKHCFKHNHVASKFIFSFKRLQFFKHNISRCFSFFISFYLNSLQELICSLIKWMEIIFLNRVKLIHSIDLTRQIEFNFLQTFRLMSSVLKRNAPIEFNFGWSGMNECGSWEKNLLILRQAKV